MYANAKYLAMNGSNTSISVDINGVGVFVPLDPENTDYAAIMKLVAEGKLSIAPADPVIAGGTQ